MAALRGPVVADLHEQVAEVRTASEASALAEELDAQKNLMSGADYTALRQALVERGRSLHRRYTDVAETLGFVPPSNAWWVAAHERTDDDLVRNALPLPPLAARMFAQAATAPHLLADASVDDRVRLTEMVAELEKIAPAAPSARVASARQALLSLEPWTDSSWWSGYASKADLLGRLNALAEKALLAEGRAAPPPPSVLRAMVAEIPGALKDSAGELPGRVKAGADAIAGATPWWIKAGLGIGALAVAGSLVRAYWPGRRSNPGRKRRRKVSR